MSLPVGHIGLYETRSQNSHIWNTQVGPSLSKLQSWLNNPMENLGLFSTNMWTTPGMRKQQGLPQRRKQHLNICTGLREPKLPKRPGDSCSLEKLKTLPENHQSHTAWFHTSVDSRQAARTPFHLQVRKIRSFNKHRHMELSLFSNTSDRTQDWGCQPGSHYHRICLTLALGMGEANSSPLIVVLQAESTNHFLNEELHAIPNE